MMGLTVPKKMPKGENGMKDVEKFINEKQVAEMTSLSVATLRNDRWLGPGIPYVKLGRSVRYSLEAVLNYMQAHTVEVAPK
jgi:predicted DNA-binding transcriptional regulator AlpA